MNRLLKPNTSLANDAQNKKFADSRQTITKRATVTSFSFNERVRVREFSDRKEFSSATFPARRFGRSDAAADVSSRSNYSKRVAAFETPSASAGRSARDGAKTVSTAEFTQSRPFLEHGKSQKALSAHDTPLTIEQVRELLNRNK